MASNDIEHLKRHFLTCDICMEIYEDPVTLACYHTFCRKCYIRYCQDNRETTRKKSLQCPTCKQRSSVQNPDNEVDGNWNVEDWVKSLKPSFVIRNLLDDFVTKESGNGATGRGADRERSYRKKRRVLCPIHHADISYFCKKCKIHVCSDCGLQKHMKCGDIVKIENMGSEIRSNLETTLETITFTTQQIEQWVKEAKRQMRSFSRLEINVREEIKMTSENVVKMIEEWERKILEEVKSVAENLNSKMTVQLTTWEADLQMFRQHSEFIRLSLEEGNEMNMIDTYNMCHFEDILTKADRRTQLDLPQEVTDLQLDMCFDQTEIKKNCHLGNLRVQKVSSVDVLRKRNYKPLTASPLFTLKMSSPTDQDIVTPNIIDVVVMEVDGTEVLIATDPSNSCLKSLFFSKNSKQPSICRILLMRYGTPCVSLQLRSKPCCVTRLSSNKVAVSLPGVCEIVLVKVTPDLTIQSTITTQRTYGGLTFLNKTTLAASCKSPPCVDILDLRGQVKKTITPGGSLIQWPNYLSTTQEGNILVSDMGSKSVVCLTPGGDVVFTFTPAADKALGRPQGITTTTTGDILVAYYSSNKVIQLTGAGEYVRDLLTSQDGIDIPSGIYKLGGISFYKDKLFIVEGNSGKCKAFRLEDANFLGLNFKLVMCVMAVALLIGMYMNSITSSKH